MNGTSHRLVTEAAFDILAEVGDNSPAVQGFLGYKSTVAEQAALTDDLGDLEFVDVEGTRRDKPHAWGSLPADTGDQRTKDEFGGDFCAFNHFIDIRKGAGVFDDYDGYSYERGSGRLGQYQLGADFVAHDKQGDLGGLARIAGEVLLKAGADVKVDEALNYWYNDKYVHAPGMQWYRDDSPSIERYSCFAERRLYRSLEAECASRFPLTQSTGHPGLGVPYSVFMPVDNLGRYWYDRYLAEPESPPHLGMVMHAIQDASIPHHAAGTMGNWHVRYEREAGARAYEWLSAGKPAIKQLWQDWQSSPITPVPPNLGPGGWNERPAPNWRVDQLITWVALNAHKAYDDVYGGFATGWHGVDDASGSELYRIAAAACLMVLYDAAPHYPARIVDPSQRFVIAVTVAQGHVQALRKRIIANMPEEAREDAELELADAIMDLRERREQLAGCRKQHFQ